MLDELRDLFFRALDSDSTDPISFSRLHLITEWNEAITRVQEVFYRMTDKDPQLVEVRHGRWINDRGLYRCTACGELWTIGWATCISLEQMNKNCPYCPQCGAVMDGGQDDG